MDFHHFPAIGMSSKCRNEPRFHNSDQQFYEFWVRLFWSPGNNENLSYKSPRFGTGVNTWCHSISVTFKFWCWVPRESVLRGSSARKATRTAQNLKVTLIEWLLKLTLLEWHQVFRPYVLLWYFFFETKEWHLTLGFNIFLICILSDDLLGDCF